MVTARQRKDGLSDYQRNVIPSETQEGPYLQDLQNEDFRKLCEARESAAKEAKTEKKDSDDDGDKSGAK